VLTSNHHAVLSHLQEALDNLPKTVSPPAKIICVKKEFSSLKKRTIFLIGDSHARAYQEDWLPIWDLIITVQVMLNLMPI
jgi:hypothetical protein